MENVEHFQHNILALRTERMVAIHPLLTTKQETVFPFNYIQQKDPLHNHNYTKVESTVRRLVDTNTEQDNNNNRHCLQKFT